jgi:hypothetical protein
VLQFAILQPARKIGKTFGSIFDVLCDLLYRAFLYRCVDMVIEYEEPAGMGGILGVSIVKNRMLTMNLGS